MINGSVNSIETLGLVDGPGVRVVVFLNGCLLRCKFCHNPEMWLSSKANYSDIELVNKIIRYKPYFNNNGGVTFSGGEPLIQSEFLTSTVKLLKEKDVHVALDTSGVGYNYDELLELVDLVILDVKHVEEKEYLLLTGRSIQDSLTFIEKCNRLGKKIWIRQVIVPGLNDNMEYMIKLKRFIKNIQNVEKIEFLPYHKLGSKKYEKLGIQDPYDSITSMDTKECRKLYDQFMKIE